MQLTKKTVLSVVICLLVFVFSIEASAEKKIGVLLFSNEGVRLKYN